MGAGYVYNTRNLSYVWIAPVTSQIHWKQNEQEIRFRWETIKKLFFYLFHKLSVPSLVSVFCFNNYLYLPLCFLLTNYLTAYTFMPKKQGLGRVYTFYDTHEKSWKKLKLSCTQDHYWLLHSLCCINSFSTEYYTLSPLFLSYLHHNYRLL